jgi:hypothetical protein
VLLLGPRTLALSLIVARLKESNGLVAGTALERAAYPMEVSLAREELRRASKRLISYCALALRVRRCLVTTIR